MLTNIFIKRMVFPNNTYHRIYRSLVYHSGGSWCVRRELTPGCTKGTFPVCHLLVEWRDLGFQVVEDCPEDTRWMPGRSLDHVESFAAFDDQQVRCFSNCFFQLTFPTKLSFPQNGPWHGRFSRSKGQSDVPKCDQWPPRQPPEEDWCLRMRAIVLITTCCTNGFLCWFESFQCQNFWANFRAIFTPKWRNVTKCPCFHIDTLIYDTWHQTLK